MESWSACLRGRWINHRGGGRNSALGEAGSAKRRGGRAEAQDLEPGRKFRQSERVRLAPKAERELDGYGADVMAKAMEVADATATILTSDFREGYDRLNAVRAKYANEPWFKHIHGVGRALRLPTTADEINRRGRRGQG